MLFSFTLHKNNLPILVHESRGLFICTGSYLDHQLTIWRHLVILLLCDCNDAKVFSCTMHLFIFLFGILFQRENDWPFFSIWRFHFSKTIFFLYQNSKLIVKHQDDLLSKTYTLLFKYLFQCSKFIK